MRVNISRGGFYLFLFSLVIVMTKAVDAAYELSQSDEMDAAVVMSFLSESDTSTPSPSSEQDWVALPGMRLLKQACLEAECPQYKEPQYMLDVDQRELAPTLCLEQPSPVLTGGDCDMPDVAGSDTEIEDWTELVGYRNSETQTQKKLYFIVADESVESSNEDDSDFECKLSYRESRPFFPQKPRCPQCKKIFSANDKLIDHMLDKHLDRPIITCPFCTELFERRAARNIHVKDVHQGSIKDVKNYREFMSVEKEQIYKVLKLNPVDNADTVATWSLKDAIKEIFVCNINQATCKRTFRKFNHLAEHLCQVHLKSYEFECPCCEIKFACSGYLAAHLRNKHNKSIRSLPETLQRCHAQVDALVKTTMYKIIKKS